MWECQCDCGNKVAVHGTGLIAGSTTSCGCYRREFVTAAKTIHGKAASGVNRSRVYNIWNGMKNRCGNPNQPHYERYGGRGIKVCDRWKEFVNFYADMGDPPSDGHSIDRIDNDGNYEPGNCRWATSDEQKVNKRPRRWRRRPTA